jgi:putative membrane protein
MKFLKLFLKGLFMGSADIVPGVSGGTIAFITGIYEEFISTISNYDWELVKLLFQGKFNQAYDKANINFIVPLLSGIILAIFLFSGLIGFLITTYPNFTYSFFGGLILGSAYLLLKKAHFKHTFSLFIGFILAYYLSGLNILLNQQSYYTIFFVAMIAILAMILPGISGAFILLLLGHYHYVLNAVHNFEHKVIIVFVLGAITGIVSFSKLLNYFLKHHEKVTFTFLLGLMLGSLRRPYLELINPSINNIILPLVLGIVLVVGIEVFSKSKI